MLAHLLCEQKETRIVKTEKSWNGGSCTKNITGIKNQMDFLKLRKQKKGRNSLPSSSVAL